MRIVYFPVGNALEHFLVSGLRSEGHSVAILDSPECLDALLGLSDASGANAVDTLIAHIEDSDGLGRCIEVLYSKTKLSSMPEFLFILKYSL